MGRHTVEKQRSSTNFLFGDFSTGNRFLKLQVVMHAEAEESRSTHRRRKASDEEEDVKNTKGTTCKSCKLIKTPAYIDPGRRVVSFPELQGQQWSLKVERQKMENT